MDLLHIGLYTGTFLELIITNYILLISFICIYIYKNLRVLQLTNTLLRKRRLLWGR